VDVAQVICSQTLKKNNRNSVKLSKTENIHFLSRRSAPLSPSDFLQIVRRLFLISSLEPIDEGDCNFRRLRICGLLKIRYKNENNIIIYFFFF